MASSVVEPYNAVLSTHRTLALTNCAVLAENEAMYEICQSKMGVDVPSYAELNGLLAQAVSSMTASLRFMGSLNADFSDFETNLVPFPRIHFPVVSYAPINFLQKASHHVVESVAEITNSCFEPSHRMVKCNTDDERYMACVLLYRGDVAPKDVNTAIHQLKNKRGVNFVGWSPTGFKLGINSSPPPRGVGLHQSPRAVCMLANSTAMKEAWSIINTKFYLMIRKRAFVHHYLTEGMEAVEFEEAHHDLIGLEQDYKCLLET